MSDRSSIRSERRFLTLLMLIVIVCIWLTVYFDMLGRG